MSEVRVRFAPSPTGYFHIGSARTALYNWLYARGRGGKFILRIEDTDEVRSTLSSIKSIISGLRFLGIDWDEGPVIVKNSHGEDEMSSSGSYGPYFQMLRKNFYRQAADRLLEEKKAYLCFCSPDELAAEKKIQAAKKERLGYAGKCRNISMGQIEKFRSEGREAVVRFAVTPGEKIIFDDKIRGKISFVSDEIADFIILRSAGAPTYNFACVVDDYMMKITDVIRGEDHISNTPRQIIMYKALGWEEPRFSHLTMILADDGSRLSKRKGARSLISYAAEGFIREAMVNYLALLGWGTKDSQNIFSIEELKNEFSLGRCSASAAIFDNEKLLWLNGQHIKKLSADDIYSRAFTILKEAGLDKYEEKQLKSAIEMEKEKIKKLTDIPDKIGFLFNDEYEDDTDVGVKAPETVDLVRKLAGVMEGIEIFDADSIEKEVRAFAKEEKLKAGAVFHPLRWSVSGRSQGPSLFGMCEFIGKEKTLKRINNYVVRYGGAGGN